ncbi:MAG: polysaccharide pyruvyl transferase family protein, partial [FCB group bacterium]|nr:polysaccharide pyruvyl transferase family protein [FCB group bacterium]
MKILLVDAYSAAHVGNAALLECSLDVLRETFPGATFEVLAKDPGALEEFCGCPCHSYLFPDLLSPERRSRIGALTWIAKNLAWAAVDALNLGLGLGVSPLSYSFDERRREAVRALLEADLVVGIGGEMLNARFRRVTPFLLHGYWTAKRLGKRVVLFPQSIGPLGNGWFMRLSRLALRDCDLVMPRDELSALETQRLGLSAGQVLRVPDVAVLQRQASREKAIELLRAEGWPGPGEGPVLGVAVCAEAREAFAGLRGLCEYVVLERSGQLVFLCANHPEDCVAAGELFSSLSDAARARSVLLSKCYRPGEFKAITGLFDVFVSTRMHAAILATMSPVPTIAINTQPKVRGYMELAGQGERCLELAEANEVRLRGMFENCLAHNEA